MVAGEWCCVLTARDKSRGPRCVRSWARREEANRRRPQTRCHRAHQDPPAEDQQPEQDGDDQRLGEDRGDDAQRYPAAGRRASEGGHGDGRNEEDIRVSEKHVVQIRKGGDEPDEDEAAISREPPMREREDCHDRQRHLQRDVGEAEREGIQRRERGGDDRRQGRVQETRVRIERLAGDQPLPGVEDDVQVERPPARAPQGLGDPPGELPETEDRHEGDRGEPRETHSRVHGSAVPPSHF